MTKVQTKKDGKQHIRHEEARGGEFAREEHGVAVRQREERHDEQSIVRGIWLQRGLEWESVEQSVKLQGTPESLGRSQSLDATNNTHLCSPNTKPG